VSRSNAWASSRITRIWNSCNRYSYKHHIRHSKMMKRVVTCYFIISFYLLVCFLAVYNKKHFAAITIFVPICEQIPSAPRGSSGFGLNRPTKSCSLITCLRLSSRDYCFATGVAWLPRPDPSASTALRCKRLLSHCCTTLAH
jgi:hypothetical protein